MSKTKNRSKALPDFFVGATLCCLSATAAFSGCATKTTDGDGSESHFVVCTADSDCAKLGVSYRCVDLKCAAGAKDAGSGREAGSGGANGGESGSAGGANHAGGTANGGNVSMSTGGADNVKCPPSLYYPFDGSPESVSPPGYLDGGIYGCYPGRPLAPVGWMPSAGVPVCPGTSGRCTYAPTALPCGACTTPGDVCAMSVEAICDCGAGPFIDIYWDQWGCRCENGTWDCGIVAPSGASCTICSNACSSETRSTPYSTGMVTQSPSGVTVALSSVPAPPKIGDNDWTLTVKDSGGNPITGATITVLQWMPDHAHGGTKTPQVTELGNGDYDVNPVNFNMTGYWETTLEVKKAALDEKITVKLCVD